MSSNKIDCKECDGKGKVEVPSYREQPEKELVMDDKPSDHKHSFPSKIKGVVKSFYDVVYYIFIEQGLLFVLTVLATVVLVVWLIIPSPSFLKERAYENNKAGEIIVEYDAAMTPIKCFVQRNQTYSTTNPSRTVKIEDRHSNIDVMEEAKLLGWDEDVKPCHRFHYDFDVK